MGSHRSGRLHLGDRGNVPEKGWLLGYHWKNERSEKRKHLFVALNGRYYSGEHTSVWRGGETTRKEKKRPKKVGSATAERETIWTLFCHQQFCSNSRYSEKDIVCFKIT